MNWRKNKNQSDENSYWQTIADALAALLLVVLLIMVLLVLYIVRVQPNEYVDLYEGDHYVGMTDPDPGAGDYGDHDYDNGEARFWENGDEEEGEGEDRDDDGGGGGGDGGGIGEFPEEGTDEGEGTDKAAVYVMVLDEETQRTIKEAGIRFELYTDRDALQLLNTYYPKKVEYRNFDTTVDGVFFLPEKLALGDYYLHELTVPKGYDAADNLVLSIHEDYDWPEPYVARVMLSPSKNIIRIQMTNANTGDDISGGSYEIVAAEDIVTQDGTLRYAKGTVAAVLECNSEGYAESEPLYLGRYLLRQKQIPRYYAADLEPTEVTVEKRNGDILPNEHVLLNQKTAMTILVCDELYGNIPIANAAFSFVREGSGTAAQTVRTDEFGQLVLTDLNKNTVYRIHQIDTLPGYRCMEEDYRFVVDGSGMIEDQALLTKTLVNRTLRASIAVRSTILRGLASDYNVTLYDGNDAIIATWNSTGMAHKVEGLTAGDYYICVNGQKQSQKHIIVSDTVEIQEFGYNVWTTGDIAAAASLTVLAIGSIFILVLLLSKKRRKALTEQEETEHE